MLSWRALFCLMISLSVALARPIQMEQISDAVVDDKAFAITAVCSPQTAFRMLLAIRFTRWCQANACRVECAF